MNKLENHDEFLKDKNFQLCNILFSKFNFIIAEIWNVSFYRHDMNIYILLTSLVWVQWLHSIHLDNLGEIEQNIPYEFQIA